MQTYNRKNITVEARAYVGPKLTVVSVLKGEQIALSGDYLVIDPVALTAQGKDGSGRGTIYVVPKAEFEAAYELPAPPAPPAPTEDEVKAAAAAAAGTSID